MDNQQIAKAIEGKVSELAHDVSSVDSQIMKMAVELSGDTAKSFRSDPVYALQLNLQVINKLVGGIVNGGMPAKNGAGRPVTSQPAPLALVGQMLQDPESYANLKHHVTQILSKAKLEADAAKRLEQEQRSGITRGTDALAGYQNDVARKEYKEDEAIILGELEAELQDIERKSGKQFPTKRRGK